MALAKSKGWSPAADPRAITPDLQARLNATAANPGSAQPNFGQGITPTGSPMGLRVGGGFMGQLGSGLANAAAARGPVAQSSGLSFAKNGLGNAFQSSASQASAGRVVS